MRRGFTLIELAIALVIIGILMGIGAGLIGSLVKSEKMRKTRSVVEAAKEAIKGYAVSHRVLPNESTFKNIFPEKDPWNQDLVYITMRGSLRMQIPHMTSAGGGKLPT